MRVGLGSGEFFDFQRVFMIRPWMGVLAVLLGVAAIPSVAMAQDERGSDDQHRVAGRGPAVHSGSAGQRQLRVHRPGWRRLVRGHPSRTARR